MKSRLAWGLAAVSTLSTVAIAPGMFTAREALDDARSRFEATARDARELTSLFGSGGTIAGPVDQDVLSRVHACLDAAQIDRSRLTSLTPARSGRNGALLTQSAVLEPVELDQLGDWLAGWEDNQGGPWVCTSIDLDRVRRGDGYRVTLTLAVRSP